MQTAPDTVATTADVTKGHRLGPWILCFVFLVGVVFSIAGTATPYAVDKDSYYSVQFQIGIYETWTCDSAGNHCKSTEVSDGSGCTAQQHRLRALKAFAILSIFFPFLGGGFALAEALGKY